MISQIHTKREDKTFRYKKSGEILQFFSPRAYMRELEKEDLPITGRIFLKEWEKNEDEQFFVAVNDSFSVPAVNLSEKKKGRLTGYIKVYNEITAEESYFEVRKSWLPAVLRAALAIAVIAALIWGIGLLNQKDNNGGVFYSLHVNKEQLAESKRNISFPGFTDTTVSELDPFIILGNPKENQVTFKYVLKNATTGRVIYQTPDRMAPGSGIELNAAKLLGKGTHSVVLTVNTYSTKDGLPRNGMIFNFVIEVI